MEPLAPLDAGKWSIREGTQDQTQQSRIEDFLDINKFFECHNEWEGRRVREAVRMEITGASTPRSGSQE